MARNLIDSVTRLAQMQEHDREQLIVMNEQWERLYAFSMKNLTEAKAGLDDVAAQLGIIEPQTQMPMLPPRTGTGPQATFTAVDAGDEFNG
jgi:hypothetical protein